MDKVLFGVFEEKTKDRNGEVVPNPVYVGNDGLPTHIKEVPIASVEDSRDAESILNLHKQNYINAKIMSNARYPDRFVIRNQGEKK